MSVVEIPKWDTSEDALCLPFLAVHSGREGQDLGLPLLHVLGKDLVSIGLCYRYEQLKTVLSFAHMANVCPGRPFRVLQGSVRV